MSSKSTAQWMHIDWERTMGSEFKDNRDNRDDRDDKDDRDELQVSEYLWRSTFAAAISGMSSTASFSPSDVVKRASQIADKAIGEIVRRYKNKEMPFTDLFIE